MKYSKSIIFVNPPLSPHQRYGLLSQAGALEPPLGLAYLAAVTEKMGIETSILDAQALSMGVDDSLSFILRRNPDFLGITLTTMSVKSASGLAHAVKEKAPHIKIIVGGCHLSSLPKETMLEKEVFDIGVIGEGEKTIEELIKAIIEDGDLSLVKGIAFRKGKDIVITQPRERLVDLDELPMPAFDLLPDLKRYYRSATQSVKNLPTTSLVTSRGCTGKCTFCDRKTFGNEVRMHSAEYVADMMGKLSKDFGIRGIIFEDDNFMLSERRLLNLAALLKRKKINMAWSALSRIDTVSAEKIKIAKGCGCWQLLYGIESGSQKIFDFYEKNITLEQIREAISLTRRNGICTKGFFMLGNPTDNEETMQESKDFIMNTPFDDISLTFFTPYPGADLWNSIDRFGCFDRDFDRLSCFDIVFVPYGTSKKSLQILQAEILRRFYRQPRILYSYLKRLRSISQLNEFYKSWHVLSDYAKVPLQKKELMVNADDFGLCHNINGGIAELLEKKILGGVSIIAGGERFEEAIGILKNNPPVFIGAHLYLTMAKPISEKKDIPSLVNKLGDFDYNMYKFLLRYLFGRIKKEEISREFHAQIEKLKKAGIKISHIDSHQHIHMLPGIFKIVVGLAKGYGISHIRLTQAPVNARFFRYRSTIPRKFYQLLLNLLSVFYKFILRRNGIGYYKYSFGFLESGQLDKDDIRKIFSSLGYGRHSLICHPGEKDNNFNQITDRWRYRFQQEFEALNSCNLKELADSYGVILSGTQE